MALVAIYAAAGFWLVPRLVRSNAQEFVSDNYARKAEIGEIRFNPFTFTLEVDKFAFPDADGQPLASFESLLVNLELSSLWRRGASFQEIAIEQPFARVVIRENGALNLAELFEPFADEPGSQGEQEEPTRLFIDRFAVNGGQARFEDRTQAKPFLAQFKPITFELRDFSTSGDTDNAYDLHAEAGTGETFDWGGSFSLAPLASKGRFRIGGRDGHNLWAYLRESLALEISSGALAMAGSYDFRSTETATDLQLTVSEFSIADLGFKPIGQAENTAQLTSVKFTNAQLDLAKQEVVIGKVEIAGGIVHAWRDETGDINLLALGKGSDAGATAAATVENAEAPTAAEESPWTFSAPDVQLQALAIQVEDRGIKPAVAFSLDPFNLHVAGYSTAPGTRIDITTDAHINESGRLEADTRYALDDGSLEGNVKLASFDLTAIQPYLDLYTQMNLLSGRLSSELAVSLDKDSELAAKGAVQIDKLRTVDKQLNEDFIKWDMARADGIDYDSRRARLRIKSITTRALYARVLIAPDETVNLVEVMKPANPVPATQQTDVVSPSASPELSTFAVAIDSVKISDGSMNFADFWIQPNYAVSVQSLNGTIVGLSSDPASRAKLELEGKVDRYAPATIGGEVNLLSASLYTDIQMKFTGVEMTSVTPYSGRFAGYKIEKGKLTVDLSYHVENRQLVAKQKFVIDQLQLGEKVDSPDAVSLPLKLAVALLKDRNGVIDIDLPMTGSLDDPKFRIGPLIWKLFVGLLTKIATAPFALLGKLFGGGEEINFVDFDPGSSTLDPTGQEKMAALLKGLQERPALQLDVPMAYSAELDGPALGRQQLDKALATLAADAASLADPSNRFELLKKHYAAAFGKDAPLPAQSLAYEALKKKDRTPEALAAASTELETELIRKQPVPELVLEALGKARAQSVQEVLLGGGQVDPGRVFVITADAKPATAADSRVRMELSLK